jgi:hypothetical protein
MNKRRILSAQANDENPNEIIVELDNGTTILLDLGPKFSAPLFAEIPRLCLPRTDGERVYWVNGASLHLDEIMEMLTDRTDPEIKLKNGGN